MTKDRSNRKKVDLECVLAAIKSVKERGWDLNPYTVADEAGIPHSLIYRNPEFMDLILNERDDVSASAEADSDPSIQTLELEEQRAELERRLKQVELKLGQAISQGGQAISQGTQPVAPHLKAQSRSLCTLKQQ